MKTPEALEDLQPSEYEHPLDAKALRALRSVPGMDTLIRQFNKHAIERYFTIKCTGSSLKVTSRNYPDVYDTLRQCCRVTNCRTVPDLYIEWGYGINGYTIGVDHPIIVIQSGCVDLLDEAELRCVIGHEVGHINSRHTLYHQMAEALPFMAELIGNATLGLGKLASTPLQFALWKWHRLSELTADRAGLLASQDQAAFIRLLAKMAGAPLKHYGTIDCEAFMQQARDFDKLDDKMDTLFKWAQISGQEHPWTVLRAAEILRWVDSGGYDSVMNRDSSSTRRRLNGASGKGSAKTHEAAASPEAGKKTLLECPNCSQQLRIPTVSRTIKVKCTTCLHVFSHP